MPNHVTSKIIFDAQHADTVFVVCCPDGKFDFDTLIPSPPHKYEGHLSREDENDFPVNWSSWNRSNWGTKWNAYNQECGVSDDGNAFIKFDTAWSVPYPVIVAFGNKFKIDLELKYFDEGHNFWGIEKYNVYDGSFSRFECAKSRPDDLIPLSIELKGYDPSSDEEE